MKYLLNRNTLQLFIGALFLGAGLLTSSLILIAAGGVMLALGILNFWPNLPLKPEHMYVILLMTIGIASLINGFRTSDETEVALGVAFMIYAIALNTPLRFREEDLTYVSILKFMIIVIIGYSLGIGLYNFVLNYML